MLDWFAAGFALLAGAVTVRAFARPRRVFPCVTVAVLVLAATAAATPGARRWALERRLSEVAGLLAGRDVDVRCQSAGGAFVDAGAELGYVRFRADGTPERTALLKWEQCARLRSYLRGGRARRTDDAVVAVHVLTHEAMHLAGIREEAATECAAVQRDALTAQLLGAAPGEARALASTYWTQFHPRMPEVYRSRECRPGGALDERLPFAPWSRSLPG